MIFHNYDNIIVCGLIGALKAKRNVVASGGETALILIKRKLVQELSISYDKRNDETVDHLL